MRALPLEINAFPCGYFNDRSATYDHYLLDQCSDRERRALLDLGYRSFGKYFFRPICENCERCVPIRIPLDTFHPSKSQRRVLKKCHNVSVQVGTPQYSPEKYRLYREHFRRFPGDGESNSEASFRSSFYDPSQPCLEFCYYLDEKLIAVGLVNETPSTLSSVYFFYSLDFGKLSLGTFSILKELEYGREQGKEYLYLGYYIHLNRFMKYKGEFRPSEILNSQGKWVPFRDERGKWLSDEDARWTRSPSPLMEARFSQWPNLGHQKGHQEQDDETNG